jgi:hypothetical protein
MTVSALDHKPSTDQFDHRIRKLGSQHSSAALTTHFQSSILIRKLRPYELRMPMLLAHHNVQEAILSNGL